MKRISNSSYDNPKVAKTSPITAPFARNQSHVSLSNSSALAIMEVYGNRMISCRFLNTQFLFPFQIKGDTEVITIILFLGPRSSWNRL
jgi:hypothetical protein